MKGIILAGGAGTRLYPLTSAISKQILPVYDKPMIYYPLATLMEAEIRDILIISTKHDLPTFQYLFGNGMQIGLNISYEIQEKPRGLAEAFIIGEKFIGNDDVCLILGDNIFYGDLKRSFKSSIELAKHGTATFYGYQVNDPERYGVAVVENETLIGIEEKPSKPKSNWAITGLYFYPNDVVKIAKYVKPSKRGELEITTINNFFIKVKDGEHFANIYKMPLGSAWLDTGTFDSLAEASAFVEAIQKRTGKMIGCIDEIAINNGWVTKEEYSHHPLLNYKNSYCEYLKKLVYE